VQPQKQSQRAWRTFRLGRAAEEEQLYRRALELREGYLGGEPLWLRLGACDSQATRYRWGSK